MIVFLRSISPLIQLFKDGLFSSLVDYHLYGVQTIAIFTLGIVYPVSGLNEALLVDHKTNIYEGFFTTYVRHRFIFIYLPCSRLLPNLDVDVDDNNFAPEKH